MRNLKKIFLPALLALVMPTLMLAAGSPFDGHWQLDKTRSSALDGWHEWELVINVSGDQVSLQHNMKWGRTDFSATNTVDTTKAVTLPNFFRVEQRHMALYPAKGQATPVRAAWLDAGRTLRVEADATIEISQGEATMRIYSEFRLIEGDREIQLIELHSSRSRPLVYRFTKVAEQPRP